MCQTVTGPEEDNEESMTQPPVHLDDHRSETGRVEVESRRDLLAEIRSGQMAERRQQQALEEKLFAQPATTWAEAAAKSEYLLRLLAAMPEAQPPERQKLITHTLDDLARLRREELAQDDASASEAREPGPTDEAGDSE